jgi:Ca-activated chloride channel family protein
MINDGSTIPADAVRLEEMINYFSYDYPEPKGDELFSVTRELAECPWNDESKLLLIGVQAKNIDYDELPASNFVFLLDVSGSMYDSNKLPLVVDAMKLLTENLREEDRISIVTYAGDDAVVLDGVSGENKLEITTALDGLEAGGSTQGSAGINTAYEIAEKHFIEGGNNRVILATDGDLNVGITSEGALTDLITEKAETGVFLSVLGFGTGNIKDNKMEALADNGNGNFSYIDTILEAKKVLVEEMGGTLFTVAKDVKFQVEFNPEQVKGYRLIGYENRLMDAEDFADDTKDAGEIGAGHRVTVLYEIVLPDSEIDIPESTLKYQEESSTISSDERLTVSIRYKMPDGDESTLVSYPVSEEQYSGDPSENLKFAACVAQFGMLLRDSEFKGSATYESVLDTLSDLYCVNADDYKEEFYSLVKKMDR